MKEKASARSVRNDRGMREGQAERTEREPVWGAGGADGDLDVMAEGGEEFHEAADAEVAGAIAH